MKREKKPVNKKKSEKKNKEKSFAEAGRNPSASKQQRGSKHEGTAPRDSLRKTS